MLGSYVAGYVAAMLQPAVRPWPTKEMLAYGALTATFRHTHEKRRVAFWFFLVDGRVGLAVACDFAFGGAFGLLSAAFGMREKTPNARVTKICLVMLSHVGQHVATWPLLRKS